MEENDADYHVWPNESHIQEHWAQDAAPVDEAFEFRYEDLSFVNNVASCDGVPSWSEEYAGPSRELRPKSPDIDYSLAMLPHSGPGPCPPDEVQDLNEDEAMDDCTPPGMFRDTRLPDIWSDLNLLLEQDHRPRVHEHGADQQDTNVLVAEYAEHTHGSYPNGMHHSQLFQSTDVDAHQTHGYQAGLSVDGSYLRPVSDQLLTLVPERSLQQMWLSDDPWTHVAAARSQQTNAFETDATLTKTRNDSTSGWSETTFEHSQSSYSNVEGTSYTTNDAIPGDMSASVETMCTLQLSKPSTQRSASTRSQYVYMNSTLEARNPEQGRRGAGGISRSSSLHLSVNDGSHVSVTSSNAPEPMHCEDCGSTFTGNYRRGNYQRHRRQSHGQIVCVYACEDPDCTKRYKRPDARLKHYRKEHAHLACAFIARK